MKTSLLIASTALNIFLATTLFYTAMTGCAEISDGKIGVLARDLSLGEFGTEKTLFTLPKGLVVRDASASGAGWFEPHRFRIVITSNDPDLVDYQNELDSLTKQENEYYSSEM